MRPWIVLALLAAAAVAAFRHATGHKHPVLIGLLIVPALFLGWQEWSFRQDQQKLSQVATQIAGRQVTIECQRFTGALVDASGEAGYVYFDGDGQPDSKGRLERDACNDLRDWLHSDMSNPTLDQVVAVQVLSHESYHLAGIRSESQTECAAMQRLDEVAQWLGATHEQARALAERYAAQVYPRMPTDYRDAECQDGGGLDTSPDDAIWP